MRQPLIMCVVSALLLCGITVTGRATEPISLEWEHQSSVPALGGFIESDASWAVGCNYGIIALYRIGETGIISLSDGSIVGDFGDTRTEYFVDIQENRIVYVEEDGRAVILSIIDSGKLKEESEFQLSRGDFVAIDLSGDFLYVVSEPAHEDYTIISVDLANLDNPEEYIYQSQSSGAVAVSVDQDILCLAGGNGGLLTYDVSNPGQVTLLGGYGSVGNLVDISVIGNTAFAADTHNTLKILDLSDPVNPTLKGFGFVDFYPECVSVSGNFAAISNDSHAALFDVTDHAQPEPLGELQLVNQPISPATTLANGHLIVSDIGLRAYQPDQSSNLAITDEFPPPFDGGDVFQQDGIDAALLRNGRLYAVQQDRGLDIWGVGRFGNLDHLGHNDAIVSNHNIVFRGDYAYIASEGYGISTVDFTDPLNPVHVGYVEPSKVFHIALNGDILVARYDAAIKTFSLEDPTTPRLLATSADDQDAIPFGFVDGFVYTIGVEDYISRHDIRDPENIVYQENYLEVPYIPEKIVSGDRFLAITSGTGQCTIIDVAEQASPEIAHTLEFEDGSQLTLATQANRLYIASNSGIRGYDLTDPANPIEGPLFPTDGERARTLLLDGSQIIAIYPGGLQVLTHPDSPTGWAVMGE